MGHGGLEFSHGWPQILNPAVEPPLFTQLSTLDPGELEDLLEEQGSITMDCEFCNQQYRFAREDLEEVLGSDGSKTLH